MVWKRWGTGKKEVEKLFAEQSADGKPEVIELGCRFCGKKYEFTRKEADALFG